MKARSKVTSGCAALGPVERDPMCCEPCFDADHLDSADIGRQRSARQQNLDEHPGRKLAPSMHLDVSLHQDVAADNEFACLRTRLGQLSQLEELTQPNRSIGFDRGDAVGAHTGSLPASAMAANA